MSLKTWVRLYGPASQVALPPPQCPHCGGKEFYRQPDFRRSVGLGIVITASLATIGLEFFGRDLWSDSSPALRWSLVWTPMFFALFFDRILIQRYVRNVLICYRCEHLFRGISETQLRPYGAFDLEIHDRYRYQEQMKAQESPPPAQ